MSKFCNLHQHTTESHLDAICNIDKLFDRAKELGQRAIAVTDHGTMGGIYRAWKAGERTGVKLIPGNEIYFTPNLAAPDKDPETKEKNLDAKRYHLVLLASNEQGYKNLLRITYEGFKNSVTVMGREFPRVDEAILRKYRDGLFALSACGGNIIAQALFSTDEPRAIEYAKMLQSIYGDRFFIELQPHGIKRGEFSQIDLNARIKKIAEKLGIQMVATCDAHYIRKEDEKYHDMVLAIADKKPLEDMSRHTYTIDVLCDKCSYGWIDKATKLKCTNPMCVNGVVSKQPCAEFYLKEEMEIRQFFAKHFSDEFAENLINNVSKIVDSCEYPSYIKPSGVEHIPKFDMTHISQCDDVEDFLVWRERYAKTVDDDVAYMRYLVKKGFDEYTSRKGFDRDTKKIYWERLKFEVNILETRGFSSYMLIVSDYIRWAKRNDILVGPGRGSAGGSLAAFFLGIHIVDPVKYGLYFERFHNLQKTSLPDIDTDFAPSGRARVFEYCSKKYGEENVAYVSNVNRFTPKVVLTDIIRSLLLGGDTSSAFKLAKEITAEIPAKIYEGDKIREIKTLEEALEVCKGGKLLEMSKKHPEVFDYARMIVGLPRNYSTHAGAIVISDKPLPELVPVRRDKDGAFAVMYDKTQVEENGLVKMDQLGLATLDVISDILAQSKAIGIKLPDLETLCMDNTDDPGAFKVIESGHVSGLFQLEGKTLQGLCKPMRARSIEDIALINALGRPSVSKADRERFLARRDGKAPTTYPHPLLEDILKPTYGISLYEEDLLRIAPEIAGWDLSEADGLRKITKLKEKGAALAEKLETKFIEDSVSRRGISKAEAAMIWNDVILPYSKYGFNHAHAITYGLLGYVTAYYKYHARAPFFAATLNNCIGDSASDSDATVATIKEDARRFGVKIHACDINKSKYSYVAISPTEIVTGLGAIDGLGAVALASITANQPYRSFEEFLLKNPKKVNKNHIIALAKAGAFDSLGVSRKYIVDNWEAIKEALKKAIKGAGESATMNGELLVDVILENFSHNIGNPSEEWTLAQKLEYEKEVLGEYVSGGAKDLYPTFFKGGKFNTSFKTLPLRNKGDTLLFEGIVNSISTFEIKRGASKGKTMARVVVENLKGETADIVVFAQAWEKYGKALAVNRPIIGEISVLEDKASKEKSWSLEKVLATLAVGKSE